MRVNLSREARSLYYEKTSSVKDFLRNRFTRILYRPGHAPRHHVPFPAQRVASHKKTFALSRQRDFFGRIDLGDLARKDVKNGKQVGLYCNPSTTPPPPIKCSRILCEKCSYWYGRLVWNDPKMKLYLYYLHSDTPTLYIKCVMNSRHIFFPSLATAAIFVYSPRPAPMTGWREKGQERPASNNYFLNPVQCSMNMLMVFGLFTEKGKTPTRN